MINSGSNNPLKENSFAVRALLFGCGLLVVIAIAFSIGSGVGFAIGRMNAQDVAQGPGLSAGLRGDVAEEAGERTLEEDDLEIFWEAMELLERDFYGELPAPQERSYGAIRGVLDLLDDPHTSFLTPEQAQSFYERIEGSFEGIGAVVEWNDDLKAVRIVEPYENQPAWKAGLRRNDLIIAVDGEEVADMVDLTEAISKIKGPEGTMVVLTILREGEEPFDVEVERDVIQIPVVSTDTLGENDDIGYVQLNSFSDRAGDKLDEAIQSVLADEPSGLILDLRGNPGGLLREAVKVTSLFLDEGEVVLLERFSDGTEEIYRTEGGRLVPDDLPMVVLVNEASASASEIVAGALQDAGRAVLVGATTFGKGSVQLPHHLSDGSVMNVTIARWYTPNDRSIDGSGLEPDIYLEISEEELEADEDPQLERAIKLLETGQ